MSRKKRIVTVPEKKLQVNVPINLLDTIREISSAEGVHSDTQIVLQALYFYKLLLKNIGVPIKMENALMATTERLSTVKQ